MRRWLATLVVLLRLLAHSPSANALQHGLQEPTITLTAKLISQHYCGSNSKQATLQMRVQLRYTNVSNRKIILYRGHDLFYQTKIQRTVDTAGAKPYELMTVNSRYFDEEPELIEAAAPGRVFVILSPGDSYEREEVIGIGVVDENAERGRDTVAPGQHTLYFVVSTWYKSRSLAEQLRRQWQRKGFLWFDPLASTSLRLKVEHPVSSVPCR